MFCYNCGFEINNSITFCPKCGTKNQFKALLATTNDVGKKKWYFYLKSERKGPFTDDEINTIINHGLIKNDTKVYTKEIGSWVAAGETELSERLKNCKIETVETHEIKDTWFWALATVPLLISSFIGASVIGTLIVVIINIVFLTLDTKEIEKGGNNAENWMWLGIVLVPVYLFVRAAKTNRNWWPGIVWCILFFITLLL